MQFYQSETHGHVNCEIFYDNVFYSNNRMEITEHENAKKTSQTIKM